MRIAGLCLAFMMLLLGCPVQTAPSSPPGPPPGDGYHPPPPPPPASTPDAAISEPAPMSCLTGTDCDSGICEGLGCDDQHPGTCAPAQRMCTQDARAYCGCDGQTFTGSGTCPGRRYASVGRCSTP